MSVGIACAFEGPLLKFSKSTERL
uniref:Uncharacterized protein n=1 Tax=Anguilla anguilla TaxID=7936 RepID=A0A0E9VX79_ANGAN